MTVPPPALLQEIGTLPPERFGVVDGALFEDLPRALADSGLEGRPLYLAGADIDLARAGPYLIRTDSYERASRLLGLIGDRPTGVFWSAPEGMSVLYRHLRRLNLVRIALVDAPKREQDYRTVLFRHADANVMASMVAVMTSEQRQMLLGPSPAIVYGTGPASRPMALWAESKAAS